MRIPCAIDVSVTLAILAFAAVMPGPAIAGASKPVSAHSSASFRDCENSDACPEMVALPGGEFVMGSPRDEKGRFDDEAQKSVKLPGFAIGKYLVTRVQWATFVKATARKTPAADCAYAPTAHPTWQDPGFPQGDDHPVVCVSWGDANDYVRWLSKETGKSYRLPTDNEWEYAARAGTVTAFPWGVAASHEFANYGLDTCCGPKVEGRDKWQATSPVGSFPANRFGLFDMQGNVFEWLETCADRFEKLPLPDNAKGCAHRYARGGVYADRPDMMRSAAKNFAPPPGGPMTIDNYRSAGFGFRVARSQP